MNIYESVTNRILAQLEQGIITWRKEWKSSGKTGLPYNHASGKPYRGINILLLASSCYSDARWMTYQQAQEKGGQVRKGEHGTKIIFWSLFDVTRKSITFRCRTGKLSKLPMGTTLLCSMNADTQPGTLRG